MPAKYLNTLAFSAIVFLACSFFPSPVNALSIDTGLHARHAHLGQTFAKRATNRRCKARPSSSAVSSTTTPSATPYTPAYNSPSTTTSTPAPAYTPKSGGGGGNGKACLGFAVYDNNVNTILQNFKTSQVSCVYNWGPTLVPGAAAHGYDPIPMLWGTKDLDQWKQLVVAGYASYALGFNEPNDAGQSNMDPTYAATLWKEYMLPLRNVGYKLISPATTSAPTGITWMHTFLNACGSNCVDAIALHWYGIDAQAFIQYLQLWYNTFGMSLWVTEYACQDFVSYQACPNVYSFASTVTNFMDSTWWVERYAPFAVSYNLGNVNGANQLLGGNLGPTSLAQIYFK